MAEPLTRELLIDTMNGNQELVVVSDSFVTPWTVALQTLLSVEFPR